MTSLFDPFPYQIIGADWLSTMEQAFLADGMGLGKSCQAVRGSDIIGADDILVICPANVRVNWVREYDRFSPFDRPCSVVYRASDPLPSSGVVIVSYDLLVAPDAAKQGYKVDAIKKDIEKAKPKRGEDPIEFEGRVFTMTLDLEKATRRASQARALRRERQNFMKALKARRWHVVIMDEAHYCKERDAERTAVIYGRNKANPGLIASADRVWRLSGTPAPNDASEMWTHLHSARVISDPYWDYVFRYCKGFDSTYGYKITGHKNVRELKAIMAKFLLRRTKDQVQPDLPPIYYQQVAVEPSN